ncbi:MAG: hypothetical protein ABI832_07190 [bacterium]
MNSEERNTWVALISSLIVNAWFYRQIWIMFHNGTSLAPDGLQIWARTVIWVIPVSIIVTIVLTILASMLYAVVTGERAAAFMKDERDRQFQLWGLGVTMIVCVAGFLAAMTSLALGTSGFVAFTLIYFGFSLGDLAGNLLKLALYRNR